MLGGHTHTADLRLIDESSAVLVTPSVTPYKNTNPGFTYFEVEKHDVWNAWFVYFDINTTSQSAPLVNLFKLQNFGL